MNRWLRSTYCEILKLLYLKSTRIVLSLVVILQTALAYIAAKQLLDIGLDATPETNPVLIRAIPPLEYIGFNSALFGLLPMIVLGAIYGASEYHAHSMRSSLLAVNKKSSLFAAKLFMIVLLSFVISMISIVLTISATHVALDKGIEPLILTPLIWKFIGLGCISWTGLTTLSFALGFLFRTSMVPLLFLIPQVYNVGAFLAERYSLAKLLPVNLGNSLLATSEKMLTENLLHNGLFLGIWIFGVLAIAYIRFIKSDLGGEY